MEFTRDISQATYVTYEAIDKAIIQGANPLIPQNNSTEAIYSELGRARLYADTLITRIEKKIKWSDSETDKAYKNEGLYTAYFIGAVTRYMYGMYWALNATNDNGGGTIGISPYILAADMLKDAQNRLNEALKYVSSETQARQIHTLKARIYLVSGDYANAKTEADLGMIAGDEAFSAKYNTVGDNQWYTWAGPGRTQFHAADRFGDYVYKDPKEAARIPLYKIKGKASIKFERDTIIGGVSYKAGAATKRTYLQEAKYGEFGSPIKFLTWQENSLMKAELAVRIAGDKATSLALVNEVRTFWGIDPLSDALINANYNGDYLEMIYVERDKELAFTGMRLIDQRRFNKWHLGNATWKFMPISYSERMANPNLK
jgi:hypothetical protein